MGVKVKDSVAVSIENILFGFEIDLNYHLNPCKTSVNHLKTNIQGIELDFECCGAFEKILKKTVNNILKKLTPNIVSFVKIKISEALREPLDKFSCEKYKPRMNRKISKSFDFWI